MIWPAIFYPPGTFASLLRPHSLWTIFGGGATCLVRGSYLGSKRRRGRVVVQPNHHRGISATARLQSDAVGGSRSIHNTELGIHDNFNKPHLIFSHDTTPAYTSHTTSLSLSSSASGPFYSPLLNPTTVIKRYKVSSPAQHPPVSAAAPPLRADPAAPLSQGEGFPQRHNALNTENIACDKKLPEH